MQDIVHLHGGILGPAHPCSERHLSITQTRAYKRNPDIMKPFGSSDSHHLNCVGTAYTQISEAITTESDLISCLKRRIPFTTGGTYYSGTVKQRIGILNHVLVEPFWFYNRFASLARAHRRKTALQLLP